MSWAQALCSNGYKYRKPVGHDNDHQSITGSHALLHGSPFTNLGDIQVPQGQGFDNIKPIDKLSGSFLGVNFDLNILTDTPSVNQASSTLRSATTDSDILCFNTDMPHSRLKSMINAYWDQSSKLILIDSIATGSQLTEGHMVAVLGGKSTVQVMLKLTGHHFSMYGKYIKTFKLQLDKP